MKKKTVKDEEGYLGPCIMLRPIHLPRCTNPAGFDGGSCSTGVGSRGSSSASGISSSGSMSVDELFPDSTDKVAAATRENRKEREDKLKKMMDDDDLTNHLLHSVWSVVKVSKIRSATNKKN
jgi:hypothetical protein